MPILDEEKSLRSSQGYHSDSAGVFQYLWRNKKLPPTVRAVDMQHILLLLPFLLDACLRMQEHKSKHPLQPVVDPSSELIKITLLFI
jgi:hypothetical protein